MQRFPKLVATGGALAMPLCGGTNWRLAAALIADGDRALLADALARDASLTLWAISQAHRSGSRSLRTVDALSGWLASATIDLWSLSTETASAPVSERRSVEEVRSDECQPWAALAARSIGVATLAAQIARHQNLDVPAAHLLGLLHLSPQWLAAAGGDAQTVAQDTVVQDVLPPWLRGELASISAAGSGEIASAGDCVRAAVQGTEADGLAESLAESLPGDFTFDRQAAERQIAATRDDWSCPAPENLLFTLADKLRRLRDLEENFSQTLEAEKLESLKELAYGAGHEINNPLANISARAQALLSDEGDPERRRMLASINAQAFRAHEMIADMMLFARPPRAKPEPLDVVELLTKLHDELGEQAAGQQTEIVLHAPHMPVRVVADKTQIAVAIRSLCTNALEALVTGGRVEIELARPAPADGSVQITISDNGPGIPAEVRPHVFDPFYSGREAGRGLGLGLSKCWRIVTMHQGRLDVDSPNGRGAVFTVTLPAGNTR